MIVPSRLGDDDDTVLVEEPSAGEDDLGRHSISSVFTAKQPISSSSLNRRDIEIG
jgi:hypothetical protein